MFSVRGSTARANTCRIWMTIHSSYHQENLSIIIEGWSCQIQTSSKSPPSWYIWPAVCRAPATRLSAPPRGCSHSERQSLKPHLFIGLHFNLGPTIIIIITRPWPAFGRQGLVGSSGGYTYHWYTSYASPRACGARLGRKVSRNGRNVISPIYRHFCLVSRNGRKWIFVFSHF